jgi:hypothetical protein
MTLPGGFPGGVGDDGSSVLLMSDRKLSRLKVLRDLDQKRLTTKAPGQLLGLERRQVFRLLKAYRRRSDRPDLETPWLRRAEAGAGVADLAYAQYETSPDVKAGKFILISSSAFATETAGTWRKCYQDKHTHELHILKSQP